MRRPLPTILLLVVVLGACAAPPTSSPPSAPVASHVSPSSAPPSASPDAPSAIGSSSTTSPVPVATPGPRSTPAVEVAAPSPSIVTTPSPTATPGGATAVNLARVADFVPQYTFDWCVGASIQMTRSIVTGEREESRASQRRYWEMARERTIGSPYGGANPVGWAAALNDLDLGPYRLVSLPTFDTAVSTAARALAQTGRPVGLVMWAGRHAWLMTGYEATADPVSDPRARITRVRVMDPLYPHGSRWGPSPEPNQLVSRKTLRRQFVLRDRPDYDFGVEPGWLVVLPLS
jgi:hypothetical protein